MNDREIKRLFSEIKNLKKELNEKGNGDYSKVNSKDILFYFLTKIEKIDTRLTAVETTQKNFMWLIPVLVAATGVICKIIF